MAAGFSVLLLRGTLGVKSPEVWRKVYSVMLSLWWAGWTIRESALGLSSLANHDWGSVEFLLSYLWPSSLAIGVLYLCGRAAEVAAISPLALALIAAVGPQGAGLYLVPLLAALGFFPGRQRITRVAWSDALAGLVEMASLQTVAWTVVCTLVTPIGELVEHRYLDATFSFFATGAVGWLSSGLLWGLSVSLRPTEKPRRRL